MRSVRVLESFNVLKCTYMHMIYNLNVILIFSLKIGIERGLYIHSEFIENLNHTLRGRFRSSNITQNLEKYNPNLINDYTIQLSDLSKGVFFLSYICYGISLFVFITEIYIKTNCSTDNSKRTISDQFLFVERHF